MVHSYDFTLSLHPAPSFLGDVNTMKIKHFQNYSLQLFSKSFSIQDFSSFIRLMVCSLSFIFIFIFNRKPAVQSVQCGDCITLEMDEPLRLWILMSRGDLWRWRALLWVSQSVSVSNVSVCVFCVSHWTTLAWRTFLTADWDEQDTDTTIGPGLELSGPGQTVGLLSLLPRLSGERDQEEGL